MLLTCLYASFDLFSFNATSTTEIYTLSLHDALPILRDQRSLRGGHHGRHARHRHRSCAGERQRRGLRARCRCRARSEEHTSELQSQFHLVCRLLLEKKKKKKTKSYNTTNTTQKSRTT